MRGSPLIRTLLLACALVLAGWGMLHFIAASASTETGHPTDSHTHAEDAPSARYGFAVKLSHPAESFQAADRSGRILFQSPALIGQVALDPTDPVVFLTVKWKEPATATANHFAKVTLEPPGKPTVSRYFETPDSELIDVWELPTE